MRTRTSALPVGAALALRLGELAHAAAAPADLASRPRSNIIFIVMDKVSIDQMRVFGYDATNQPRTHLGPTGGAAQAIPTCTVS
jgi:hypothetical protein